MPDSTRQEGQKRYKFIEYYYSREDFEGFLVYVFSQLVSQNFKTITKTYHKRSPLCATYRHNVTDFSRGSIPR